VSIPTRSVEPPCQCGRRIWVSGVARAEGAAEIDDADDLDAELVLDAVEVEGGAGARREQHPPGLGDHLEALGGGGVPGVEVGVALLHPLAIGGLDLRLGRVGGDAEDRVVIAEPRRSR
jgi:hypothetical protein